MDDIKGRVARVRARWPAGGTEDLAAAPHVVRVEHSGGMVLLTVDGPVAPVVSLLRRRGAQAIEAVDTDLEAAFRALIHSQGYARDAVSWVDALYKEAGGDD